MEESLLGGRVVLEDLRQVDSEVEGMIKDGVRFDVLVVTVSEVTWMGNSERTWPPIPKRSQSAEDVTSINPVSSIVFKLHCRPFLNCPQVVLRYARSLEY